MAKKQLKIPFKDGRPCKWVKDVHDEERDNYEFDECLEIHGFVRGRSSAVMILRPAIPWKDIDLVMGGFCCQSFSSSGKEGFSFASRTS